MDFISTIMNSNYLAYFEFSSLHMYVGTLKISLRYLSKFIIQIMLKLQKMYSHKISLNIMLMFKQRLFIIRHCKTSLLAFINRRNNTEITK